MSGCSGWNDRGGMLTFARFSTTMGAPPGFIPAAAISYIPPTNSQGTCHAAFHFHPP
jgi:hypothetical protein